MFERASGVLMHPVSLPGPYGIGELGAPAYAFVDWLAAAGQRYWQVLPLGPTGGGNSPYASFSAFAGNPFLISLKTLRSEGLLTEADFEGTPVFSPDRVEYGLQFTWREQMLYRAFARYVSSPDPGLAAELDAFVQQAKWLDDYSLYMALKAELGDLPWQAWPPALRGREPEALAAARSRLTLGIERVQFVQFLFWRQWERLRQYAAERGVLIIGDVPIFVAMDSADAWANQDIFYLDAQGQPLVQAGVPPDYFSATGQLWGNPLYRWDRLRDTGYEWWLRRFEAGLQLHSLLRIDHFRGLEAYWEVPYPADSALEGRWAEANGAGLLRALQQRLGRSTLPVIAEDLGIITPPVEALRDEFGLPGMAILQFAFADESDSAYRPHNLRENQVVYAGTHDNDTARGWWRSASEEERHRFRVYTSSDPTEETVAWQLTELVMHTRPHTAILPLQDLLNLGPEARFNQPGTVGEQNWSWRFSEQDLRPELAQRLRELTQASGRLGVSA
ncbi:4-alpha-glucanotransferase [Deinococcus lacus]|uniref:4-alpha-glucanotransferase n=1 Tax=Deinococcus lacus TaxID=392561 RepID=A0ABW1YCB8_9DEIO